MISFLLYSLSYLSIFKNCFKIKKNSRSILYSVLIISSFSLISSDQFFLSSRKINNTKKLEANDKNDLITTTSEPELFSNYDFTIYEGFKDIVINDFDSLVREIEKTQLTNSFTKQTTTTGQKLTGQSLNKKTVKQNGSTASQSSSSSASILSPQIRRLISEISIYLSIAICLMGIITNFLSLKVFCSTRVPLTSSRTYLIALSVTDCIFLVVHFIDDTCKQIVEQFKLDIPLNLTDQKVSMCRAFALIRSTCRSASPWIIVVFTLERFLVVNYPQHTNVISKPLIAKRLICVIIVFSVLISLYAPILSSVYNVPTSFANQMKKTTKKITTVSFSSDRFQYQTLPNPYVFQQNPTHPSYYYQSYNQNKYLRKTCDILSDYRSMYLYFTLFYTILIIVLPLIIVSVFNALLIHGLYNSTDQWSSAKLEIHEQEMTYKEIKDKQVQIENLKITWTLIIISLTFILLTLPHMIVYFIIASKLIKSSTINIIHKITELFYLLNHSVNFFLYVISRKSFRRVLKDKLKCDCFNLKHYTVKSSFTNSKGYHLPFHLSSKMDTSISMNETDPNFRIGSRLESLSIANKEIESENVNENENLFEIKNLTNLNDYKNSHTQIENVEKSAKKDDIDYESYWKQPDNSTTMKNQQRERMPVVSFNKQNLNKSPNKKQSKDNIKLDSIKK